METPAVKWNTKSDSSAEVELQKGLCVYAHSLFIIKKKRAPRLNRKIVR